MNPKYIKGFVILQVFQTAVALIWIFLSRLENKSTIFLWFTKSNIVLLLFVFTLFLISLLTLLLIYRFPDQYALLISRINEWIVERKMQVPLLIFLIASLVIFLSLIQVILSTPLIESVYGKLAPQTFPVLHTLTIRFLPLIAIFFLISIENILLLVLSYKIQLHQRTYWSLQAISAGLFSTLFVFTSLAHWLILALQLRLFVNNPVWYWSIQVKPFTARDLIYAFPVLMLLALGVWLSFHQKKVILPLLIIFVVGWWLQTGIGFLEGGGTQALQARYFNTYHRAYPLFAAENKLPVVQNIRYYEETFAHSMFTSTKPPGLMAFYISIERMINGDPEKGNYTNEIRLERFSKFITFSFPILAALSIFILYGFTRRFLSSEFNPVMPTFLFIISPNIVLFSLFIDQAVYPAVFLSGSWLIFDWLSRRSCSLAFLLGFVLYIFAFFAFTMLPLFPLAGIYLFLLWWQNPKKYPLIHQVKAGFGFLLGVVSSYWLLFWLFKYDFFTRFSKTMQVNHRFDFYERVGLDPVFTPEPLIIRIQQILQAAFWNNLDIATAVGVVMYLLFLIQGFRLFITVARRQATSADLVLTSLFAAFLTVNLVGSAQGEVARLWIFWVPMIVLLASREIFRWINQKSYLFYALLLAQFITLMLTYHFQELKM